MTQTFLFIVKIDLNAALCNFSLTNHVYFGSAVMILIPNLVGSCAGLQFFSSFRIWSYVDVQVLAIVENEAVSFIHRLDAGLNLGTNDDGTKIKLCMNSSENIEVMETNLTIIWGERLVGSTTYQLYPDVLFSFDLIQFFLTRSVDIDMMEPRGYPARHIPYSYNAKNNRFMNMIGN